MSEYMEKFEELLDEVINESSEEFEEFKKRVIERLKEIE